MSQAGGTEAKKNGNVEKIRVCVKGQDGTTLIYQVARNAKLRMLMEAYCKKKQLDFQTVRFFHEGHRVHAKYTAEEQNLEDEAEICCMLHQLGAGFYLMPKTTQAFSLLYQLDLHNITVSD